MKSYPAKLALTFAAALIADLLAMGWMRAFVDRSLFPAAALAVACGYPRLVGGFFADEKNWWKRVGYLTAEGVAGGLGTIIVMSLWP